MLTCFYGADLGEGVSLSPAMIEARDCDAVAPPRSNIDDQSRRCCVVNDDRRRRTVVVAVAVAHTDDLRRDEVSIQCRADDVTMYPLCEDRPWLDAQ